MPKYTNEELISLRNQVAPGASDAELDAYLYWCEENGFDPRKKQAMFSIRKSKCPNCKAERKGGCDAPGCENGYIRVPVFQPTIDGLLSRAESFPDYLGIRGATVHANDEFQFDAVTGQPVKHLFGAKDRGAIMGAWATINFKGDRPQMAQWYSYAEYSSVAGANMLGKIPSLMMLKAAMSVLSRRAYPTKNNAHAAEEFGLAAPGSDAIQIEAPEVAQIAAPAEPVMDAVIVEAPTPKPEEVVTISVEANASTTVASPEPPEAPPIDPLEEQYFGKEQPVAVAAPAAPAPVVAAPAPVATWKAILPEGVKLRMPPKGTKSYFQTLWWSHFANGKKAEGAENLNKFSGDYEAACKKHGFYIEVVE